MRLRTVGMVHRCTIRNILAGQTSRKLNEDMDLSHSIHASVFVEGGGEFDLQ